MEVLDSRTSPHPEFWAQCHVLDLGCYEGQLRLRDTCWTGNNDWRKIRKSTTGLEKPNQGQKSIDCESVTFQLALFNAYALANEIISQNAEPAGYGTPPPPYTDVHDDLPPEYSALPVLAEAKPLAAKSAPPSNNPTKSRDSQSKPASSIDFESTHGLRQHGKKQKAKLAAKKAVSGSSGDGGDSGKKNDETIDPPGGSGVGGSAGGGDGGDDGDKNDDGWGEITSSSKTKKSKKKQEEEEEEERKKKEAEEAAAAGTAANNLSWADDLDNNNDDSWAGFTAAGKKDNKKKNSVRKPLHTKTIMYLLIVAISLTRHPLHSENRLETHFRKSISTIPLRNWISALSQPKGHLVVETTASEVGEKTGLLAANGDLAQLATILPRQRNQ
jgi:hypothetical protein